MIHPLTDPEGKRLSSYWDLHLKEIKNIPEGSTITFMGEEIKFDGPIPFTPDRFKMVLYEIARMMKESYDVEVLPMDGEGIYLEPIIAADVVDEKDATWDGNMEDKRVWKSCAPNTWVMVLGAQGDLRNFEYDGHTTTALPGPFQLYWFMKPFLLKYDGKSFKLRGDGEIKAFGVTFRKGF